MSRSTPTDGRDSHDSQPPPAGAPAPPAAADPAPFAAWSRAHAQLVLVGGATTAALGRAWPLAALALLSFGRWIWRSRGAFTPRGGFGPANAVTALRLAMALGLALMGRDTPGLRLAAILAAVAVLDGADGWIARRLRISSVFGATFDMETDALLILVADLQLWQRGRCGAWILIAGLLRYVYVLVLAIAPPPAGAVPASRFGRWAFLALLFGLTAAFAHEGFLATALAALGTAGVITSFARSFLWSYGRR